MLDTLLRRLRKRLPIAQQQRLQRLRRPAWLGSIRRLTPLSEFWGRDRGMPVDRYYIEQFLHRNRQAIRGHVLEIRDSRYTRRFGIDVRYIDVLDVVPSNPEATIITDLAAADTVPADAFDCFILTQTLQYIYDNRSALLHIHRILRPGGTVLATMPAVSRIDSRHAETDLWRYTASAARALFSEAFGSKQVSVLTFGNVLAEIAFLMGMAAEELSGKELATHDPNFPVIIAVSAVKGTSTT
jgi:SAM-dependent methyltransferase